jgi:hypothetical protein
LHGCFAPRRVKVLRASVQSAARIFFLTPAPCTAKRMLSSATRWGSWLIGCRGIGI